jgi:acetylornithine/N-succinyldiaminopimelate aminotransferase
VVNTVANEEFLHNVRTTGAYLEKRLRDLCDTWRGASVRGRGLLWAIDLGCERAEEIRDAALARGLIVNAARPSLLRLCPSLRVTNAEIDEAVDSLRATLVAAQHAA